MEIRLHPDYLTPWGLVIRQLATEYGFPATNFDEVGFMFRLYSGGGSTLRIDIEKWKFIVDVIRRGDVILSIVAISLTENTVENGRRNGAVIARTCRIHPNGYGEDYVGSPLLKWYTVTNGSMSFNTAVTQNPAPPTTFPEPRNSTGKPAA
ncbi:hypothetical protein CMUS01_11580 [Colletotrichum musicola]|uniref:Uncharacterized protein n=1 Tax=Colletotrichum musicola TaxID=2175873 RepID=A0A8H6JVV5_9PEZI|nr:hypothetical protein CMUS01_11580 [Colletotrichum musicola]